MMVFGEKLREVTHQIGKGEMVKYWPRTEKIRWMARDRRGGPGEIRDGTRETGISERNVTNQDNRRQWSELGFK